MKAGGGGRLVVVIRGELLGEPHPLRIIENHQAPAHHGAVAGVAEPRRHAGRGRCQRLLTGDAHLVRH